MSDTKFFNSKTVVLVGAGVGCLFVAYKLLYNQQQKHNNNSNQYAQGTRNSKIMNDILTDMVKAGVSTKKSQKRQSNCSTWSYGYTQQLQSFNFFFFFVFFFL